MTETKPKFPSRRFLQILGVLIVIAASIQIFIHFHPAAKRERWVKEFVAHYQANGSTRKISGPQCMQVIEKARLLVNPKIKYDPAYIPISYPKGDVPETKGVCADVIVRSFRAIDIDLQQGIHEDMSRAFASYPGLWSLMKPDSNIDHRRVPNIMVFLGRNHAQLPMSNDPASFHPCDIVAWDLGRGVTHIGLVTDKVDPTSGRPLLIHHIGGQPQEEDVLLAWEMIGHFAY